jgi:hypothetical protein
MVITVQQWQLPQAVAVALALQAKLGRYQNQETAAQAQHHLYLDHLWPMQAVAVVVVVTKAAYRPVQAERAVVDQVPHPVVPMELPVQSIQEEAVVAEQPR